MWTGNKAFFLVIALLLGALGIESLRSVSVLARSAPPPEMEHRAHGWGAPAAPDGGAGEATEAR